MKKLITILVPTYNEEPNIPNLLEQLDELIKGHIIPILSSGEITSEDLPDLRNFDWQFLFINDGSRDRSLEMLLEARKTDPRIDVVNLSRNFGKENAMLAGFDYARGDATVIIDADLQDPLGVIPEMIAWWQRGFDDVFGKRRTRGRESFLRKQFSLAFYHILQGSSKVKIPSNVGDFRLLDRRVILELRQLRETQRYSKGLFSWVGYRKKEVLFNRDDRTEGRSSFNFFSLLNLAIEGITSFTIQPLRISMILGLIVSLLSVTYMVYIFIKTLIYGDPVAGFPSLMCVILFLGGVQLISIGIIGEYIGRIFGEAKHRPVYIAESLNGEPISEDKK